MLQSSENFREIFLSERKRLTYMNWGTCYFYFLFSIFWFQFSSSNSLVLIFSNFKLQFSRSNSILPNSLGTQLIYIFNSKLLSIKSIIKSSSQGHNALLSKDKGQSYLPWNAQAEMKSAAHFSTSIKASVESIPRWKIYFFYPVCSPRVQGGNYRRKACNILFKAVRSDYLL